MVGSAGLEALFQAAVTGGDGGWKRVKEEAPGALSKDMASTFGLVLAVEDPKEWHLGPGADGGEE